MKKLHRFKKLVLILKWILLGAFALCSFMALFLLSKKLALTTFIVFLGFVGVTWLEEKINLKPKTKFHILFISKKIVYEKINGVYFLPVGNRYSCIGTSDSYRAIVYGSV